MSIRKQRQAVGAGAASPVGRVIIADHADLFGGDLETGGILPPIILNQAIAIGCPDSFGFILRLSREQVAQLLEACGNLRDRLLVSLLYETGMRIGSALGLRHEDIRSWDLTISIAPRPDNADWARTKGMEPYQLQVTSELMRLYADYLVHEFQGTDCDYVFVNLWKEPKGQPMTYSAVADLFKRLSKKVGFDVHPHLLRHTHGTELVRHGLDVLTVQKRLGHQSIQTTQKYVHLSASDLNEAIRDFHRKKGGQP